MIIYEKYKPLLKRVPTLIDYYEDIQKYDRDNLYPQRCEETISRSYTLKAALDVLADFLNGEGFVDALRNDLVVNEKGVYGGTLSDILKATCKTYARVNGAAFHIGYDMNYRISSITPIPWEYCRLGHADDQGKVDEIKYSTNWEQDYMKSKETYRKITSYHIFNPDPSIVSQQIEECDGIENYKGQILYWTPEEFQYPKASFDPVFEHAQAQYDSGLYKISALQNGFMATTAIVYPGEFTDPKEKAEFKATIEAKKGAQGANGIIAIQDPSGTKRAQDIFQTLSPANVDRQWEYTESSSMKAIMENFAMPKPLLGVVHETGMFNKEDVEQAYIYFNTITRNKRAAISRFFSYLMQFWQTPIQSDFKIKEQRYIVDETATAATVNSGITKLTRKEFSNLRKYVSDFEKGVLTREQAATMLSKFGLTPEEIDLFLDSNPDNDPQIDG